MRIGQASLIVFSAKLLGSLLGFVATIVFARVVGAEVLGIYALVLTVTNWVTFASNIGIGSATTKRISEDREPEAYLTAGVIWAFGIGTLITLILVIASPLIEAYFSGLNRYVSISPSLIIIILLYITLLYEYPIRVLMGERKVHLAASLKTTKIGSQSLLQIILVTLGYSLLGMLIGYAVGGLIIAIIAIYYTSTDPVLPRTQHFRSLFNYAKYSWLGKMKSRIFNDIDILILGVFTSPATVGIYSVVWSLSKFLDLFSDSISSTLFPEISRSATRESLETVSGYIEGSLTYSGLIVLPGLVGAFILSEELLLIYGEEFLKGSVVVWILPFAMLVYAYQKQLVNALNGLDHPEKSFRINVVFSILNAGLNVVLIPQYGIEGAAIASAISVVAALLLAYYYLDRLIDFELPSKEIGRQTAAAVLMGVFVLLIRHIIQQIGLYTQNIVVVIFLVASGAIFYFTVIIIISKQFRKAIRQNISFKITD